jgi:hypothetical protein
MLQLNSHWKKKMRLPRATPLLGEKENISVGVTPAKHALRCRVHLDAWIAHTGCQAIWINFYIQFCFDVIFRSEMIRNKNLQVFSDQITRLS